MGHFARWWLLRGGGAYNSRGQPQLSVVLFGRWPLVWNCTGTLCFKWLPVNLSSIKEYIVY